MTRGVTVSELAEQLGGRLVRGDPETRVEQVMPLDEAEPNSVSFVSSPKYFSALESTRAGAILIESRLAGKAPAGAVLIEVPNAYVAFARASQLLSAPVPRPIGQHDTAVIDPTAHVDGSAVLGPFVVVGPRARIEAGAVLHAGVHVEADSQVGEDTVLENHVVLRHGSVVGARCLLHAGVVVGADGFGFAQRVGPDGLEEHVKIAQTGNVVIEDDVEIGANCCIDRAALGTTRVGTGTKIDNLVQIGHNVEIGPRCILVAQSGVAGSSVLGEEVILGAQSGVSGHLKIAPRVLVYGQAGVASSVESEGKLAGTPAVEATQFFKTHVRIGKLGELFDRVKRLERHIKEEDRDAD